MGPRGRSGRAENLVPTGIQSRTVYPVAQSLYPLSYPAHSSGINIFLNCQRFRIKKNYETIQTDKAALNMNLEIRLLLRLSEFDSLRPYQTTGVSIFRLESGAEL